MRLLPVVKYLKPWLTLVSLVAVSASAQAPADVRVALVIGNSAYAGNMALTNPVNDAMAMSATLKALGFTVIETRDGSRAQMEDAVKKLFNALKGKQGVGMLYYAGHGLQVDWKNYMVPVDAKLQTSKDVPSQTLDVGDVVDALKASGTRMNIVVLDACRDNPFADKGVKGLAPVDAPSGTFLAYATAPGNVAEDGTGQNGLYTKHLLEELQKPVSIENVFKRVRFAVRKESNGRQIPWESTSLEDDFSFAANKVVPSVPYGAQREADFAIQKVDWEKIKDSKNVDDFYEFIAKYPSGLISEIASVRIEKLAGYAKPLDVSSSSSLPPEYQSLRKFSIGDSWKTRYSIFRVDNQKLVDVLDITYTVQKSTGDNLLVVGNIHAFLVPPRYDTITPEGAYVSRKQLLTIDVEYNPPAVQLPAERFQIGYKNSSRVEFKSSGGKIEATDFDMRVSKRERVSVPLGDFDSFVVERKESSRSAFIVQKTEQFTSKSWYRADMRIPLKSEIIESNIRAVEELVSVNLAK